MTKMILFLLHSFLSRHMATRAEGISRRTAVDVERRFDTHAEFYDRSRIEAHGAPSRRFVLLLAPIVMSLDVPASQIYVRLLLGRIRRRFARYN